MPRWLLFMNGDVVIGHDEAVDEQGVRRTFEISIKLAPVRRTKRVWDEGASPGVVGPRSAADLRQAMRSFCTTAFRARRRDEVWSARDFDYRQVWDACGAWLELRAPAVAMELLPRWIANIRIGGRWISRRDSRKLGMRFPRVSLAPRAGLSPEQNVLAAIAAEFIADTQLLCMPGVDRRTIRQCEGPDCPRFIVATRVPRDTGKASRAESVTKFCSTNACRQAHKYRTARLGVTRKEEPRR